MLTSGVDQRQAHDPATNQPAFIPAAGSFLFRQIQEHRRRTTQCWLLVSMAALAAWFVGNWLTRIVITFVLPLGMGVSSQLLPDELAIPVLGGEMLTLFGASLLSMALAAILPGLTVLAAVASYRRAYTLARGDLLDTGMSLMLVDEQYALIIEELKQRNYRLRINPVDFTGGFEGRLRHFAWYYPVYYQMSYGQREPQVPQIMGGNCWFDGTVFAMSNCCCFPVSIWFFIRLVVVWPRILGIYRAVLDFLEGRFDHELEARQPVEQ